MNYEDLMRERNDANRAGVEVYEAWQSKVVDCLCLEMGFNNKEVMNEAFKRAHFICRYLSCDGFLDADDVYDVVDEFIDFYKEVMK